MPFNMAVAGTGKRTFVLAALAAEDLALAYNVEAQVISQFPNSGGTRASDQVKLVIGAHDFVAASITGYAIDADGLDDLAVFTITMTTGAYISGRGGDGGDGGNGTAFEGSGDPGENGQGGGTALRMGCETNILGTGTIEKGYGAGGGGSGVANQAPPGQTFGHGGGGGGGGQPLGGAGNGGSGTTTDGGDGVAATVAALGAGGNAANPSAGDGGDGGDEGAAAQSGGSGDGAGGSAGGDGDAIDSQTFTHSEGGGITVTGDII